MAQEEIFELDKTLHEQYAVNTNAHTSSFILFLLGLFALFGTFGYVYANTGCKFSETGEPLFSKGVFSLEAIILLSLIVNGILYFLSLISLHLGYSLRRDHFIIQKIREKYYTCKVCKQSQIQETFGSNYQADNKSFCNFIPDYFKSFFCLFFFSQVFVIATIVLKLLKNICLYNPNGIDCCGFMLVLIVLVVNLVFLYKTYSKYEFYYIKYKKNICNLVNSKRKEECCTCKYYVSSNHSCKNHQT